MLPKRAPVAARCFTNDMVDYGSKAKRRRQRALEEAAKLAEDGRGDGDRAGDAAKSEAGAGAGANEGAGVSAAGAGAGAGAGDGAAHADGGDGGADAEAAASDPRYPPIPKSCDVFGPSSGAPPIPRPEVFVVEAEKLAAAVIAATPIPTISRPFLYTGAGGVAYMLFRMHLSSGSADHLALAVDYLDRCLAVATKRPLRVSFLCGPFGLFALKAVCLKVLGAVEDMRATLTAMWRLLNQEFFDEAGVGRSPLHILHHSDALEPEVLNGRAGFLYVAAFLNEWIAPDTIPDDTTRPVVQALLAEGRKGKIPFCPMNFQWHNKWYWGTAHGNAGIFSALMRHTLEELDEEDIEASLLHCIHNKLPSGNYPSSRGSKDRLVQWCHGAPGWILVLCQAYQTFDNRRFLDAAQDAAEVVWKRGLVRKLGICHGVAGNAYAFLTLFRVTGRDVYRHRALAFASFLLHLDEADLRRHMAKPDHPHSLFEGNAGLACFFLDVAAPKRSSFPCFEL